MSEGWHTARLAELLRQDRTYINEPEPRAYKKLSVRLYGRGVVLDDPVDGATLRMKRHQVAKKGQVILSEIWGKKGAIGIVPEAGDGALCTSHFFLFDIDHEKVTTAWMAAAFESNLLAPQLEDSARGSTGYAAVRPAHLLAATLPLPPLAEQRRIVATIQQIRGKLTEAERIRADAARELDACLLAAYNQAAQGAECRPFAEVADLQRRRCLPERDAVYQEIGVRSFGKGTFHKPRLTGEQLGDKRVFYMRPGDLVFNIVFAWEGAVAVVQPEDEGGIGSHRFLTYVPRPEVATAGFLRSHFLSPAGLQSLLEASPGAAGRNKTLSVRALEAIRVPVPPLQRQRWLDRLAAIRAEIAILHNAANESSAALMPSLLDRAFRGEL